MKKGIIILASAILTVFLTLFFFLTPEQIISKINDVQQSVVYGAERSGGNFLTGYRFTNAFLAGNDGRKLFVFNEVMLDLHLLPFILGQIGIDIHSKEITVKLKAGFDGSLDGEASFNGIPFDTTYFIPPENLSFTAPISGKAILSGKKVDIEVKADEIIWKKLSVSGFQLPEDVFEKGKGGISVERNRIIIKSLAFEGKQGYARLSGEILSGKKTLMLEIFPHDWDNFMLIPLERYKVSPGQYKMPLDF